MHWPVIISLLLSNIVKPNAGVAVSAVPEQERRWPEMQSKYVLHKLNCENNRL